MHLWDKHILQALITLNILRCNNFNTSLSTYAKMYGAFDYNKTPISPPCTNVIIHEKLLKRDTWDPYTVKAWYLGPAMH